MSNPVMPKALQITTLKRIFQSLNPEADPETIDWEMEVDDTLTLPENRLELSITFPQYKWFKDEPERGSVKREALEQLEDMLSYMLTVVPPEAKDDFQKVFDDYLSRVRYAIERKLKIAPLKKQIEKLKEDLEIARGRREKPSVPPLLRGVPWTDRLERRLRDTFEATLTRQGLSPRRYLPEYRLELDVIKTLTTEDDMIKAVEDLANEIIRREIKPPPIRFPIEAPPTPPRPIIGPPREEEEEEIQIIPPTRLPEYPEKPFPTSRRLTPSEQDDVWDAFTTELLLCGKRPIRYRKEFNDWLGNFLFQNWKQVQDNFQTIVELICQEKAIPPPPARALPAEELDPLVHWLVSLRKYTSIEEIIEELDKMGKTATREDVIAAIKRGWTEKVPNFVIVRKEYLETLIGEKLE